MEPVNTKFIHDIKKYHHAHRYTNGQSKNIDERKNLILHQIAPCGFEIIFEHNELN
jgi:hypothetical protein